MTYRSILLAPTLVVALAAPAGAVILPAALPVVAHDAELVVAARVVGQRTVWHQERGEFVTTYRVQTQLSWKGDSDEFTFVPALGTDASRMPRVGADYILVLSPDAAGSYTTVHQDGGMWAIENGRVPELGVAVRDLDGILGTVAHAPAPATSDRATTRAEVSEIMTAGPGSVRFTLTRPGQVSVRVFDLAGRLVYTFPTLYLEAGTQILRWGGSTLDGVPAIRGIYFVRVDLSGGTGASQKVVWTP